MIGLSMGVKTAYMAEINLLELNEAMARGRTYMKQDHGCVEDDYHYKVRGTGREGLRCPVAEGMCRMAETMKA